MQQARDGAALRRGGETIQVRQAWPLILRARQTSQTRLTLPGSAQPALSLNEQAQWCQLLPADEPAQQMLDLFLPLCQSARQQVVGQLGQSLDGRIATVTGASRFINGEDGLLHLHRLRAISDAVVVGAGTASEDNPRLTVRLASGRNPVRVVIDPQRRVPDSHHLFTDHQAATLRLVAGEQTTLPALPQSGVVEIPCLGAPGEHLQPQRIVNLLSRLGLQRLFVEGGGYTVSSFLDAGVLDRLHVIVAPMIIGSGRAAFTLPEVHSLTGALRPRAQMINLGSDMLFDLDLMAEQRAD